jgi:hypothetical protein
MMEAGIDNEAEWA